MTICFTHFATTGPAVSQVLIATLGMLFPAVTAFLLCHAWHLMQDQWFMAKLSGLLRVTCNWGEAKASAAAPRVLMLACLFWPAYLRLHDVVCRLP